MTGVVLSGFDIKGHPEAQSEGQDKIPTLPPTSLAGGGNAGDKSKFVKEIIDKLNSLFGEATPI